MKLEFKNITKKYNKEIILNNLSLDINNVSSIGIIGESGCGKSTLLRQLAGIEDPEIGSISINGISPITQKKQFQETIGYVFQKHNLFPHLTVGQNILLILEKIKKMDIQVAKDILKKLLTQLHLEAVVDKLPSQVSGGQAQRASIARALSTNPILIFMDEPTAALDPILTKEVLKSIIDLKTSGIEFIFVTHEMEFLKQFADYIIFMNKGNIIESGPLDILKNPKTDILKKFLDK
ncbi:polar amino acid ABC transporter ATP-binding protein [Candidatus Epulonipiscium fishelsonii]|uniref:Polar amino acid ABC transporter ATP-binding protein n=1 Tax=Candidatus Epulonipiscium fishelsonii TaxID=77094 RepID=A0ACC8XB22_9FIRM|nr:polar amino acid ABC transporter ATP-binding protein [Epulopiscium sp. SCG-D08WGA-EpuloA1]